MSFKKEMNMRKYEKLIKDIELFEDWKTEELFLIDALVLSCAKLFLKAYRELIENSIVTISPSLRQIQENIVVIIGLSENVYTLDEYVNKEHNPKTIMNRIKEQKNKLELDDFNKLNDYLIFLKSSLNKYSHTNFEGIMTLFTERFQVPESITFNKVLMSFFMTFLEVPFIVIVNKLYNFNIELPQLVDLRKELNNIGTLKYATRLFPESIKNFIDNSEILKSYYLNTIKNLSKINDNFSK